MGYRISRTSSFVAARAPARAAPPSPGQIECPQCGKNVLPRADGTLRGHRTLYAKVPCLNPTPSTGKSTP